MTWNDRRYYLSVAGELYTSSSSVLPEEFNLENAEKILVTQLPGQGSPSMLRLVVFRRNLYGLGRDAKLYMAKIRVKKNRVMWCLYECCPEKLIHISVTYDQKYLWVQTRTQGFLLGKNGIESEVRTQALRNYGRDRETYLEIEHGCVRASIRMKNQDRRQDPVEDALLTYHNEIITTVQGRLLLVDWKPYVLDKASVKVM